MGVTPISVPQNIATSIAAAGDKSGVDFDYLLQTAMRESSLNPSAKAPTSSAVGLFQFLQSTWLEVMKSDGPRLGYQKYADAIVESDGEFTIRDAKLRAEVLKLREDPQVSADLAAAFTRNNGAYLKERFGRMPSPGELYIAHFLGARGAAKLFEAGLKDPEQSAVALFPRQAAANPSIFYDHGKARSIRQLYKVLIAHHEQLPRLDPAFAAQQLASATPLKPLPMPAPLIPPPNLDTGSYAVPPPAPGRGVTPAESAISAVAPESPTASQGGAPGPLAYAAGSAPRWPGEIVPSRIGPGSVSFTDLFSDGASIAPRTLLTQPEESAPDHFFFAQFYGPDR